MAEATTLHKLTHVVLAKSKLLSFTEVCKELGIQNDMELLETAMSEYSSEAYLSSTVHQNIKTKLYDIEDMLDNLYKSRHNLIIKATQPKVVGEPGHSGDEPDFKLEQRMMRPRELSESGAKRGGGGSFVLKVVMVLGLLLFVFVAFMLDFSAHVVA